MAEKLPDCFKCSLTRNMSNELMYEFHSASYIEMNDVVTFLSIIVGQLTKQLESTATRNCLNNETISNFILRVYETQTFSDVLQKIGTQLHRPSQQKLLESIPLNAVYCCIQLFFDWLEKGFYDFSSVPRPFKVNMSDMDKRSVEKELSHKWKKKGTVTTNMIQDLQQLIDALKIIQEDLIENVHDADTVSYLF